MNELNLSPVFFPAQVVMVFVWVCRSLLLSNHVDVRRVITRNNASIGDSIKKEYCLRCRVNGMYSVG